MTTTRDETTIRGNRRPESGRSGDDDALLERIRKLFAKSRSTTNPHEAELFARKAAELAARHRVDPARLAEGVRSDELAIRAIDLGRGAYMRARLSLLMAVADHHDARVVFESRPVGTVALVAGFRSDLDVIELLYGSLHQQASAQMAAIHRPTGAATQRYRRSFLLGFASRVGALLDEVRSDAEASLRRTNQGRAGGADLVLRRRGERVDDFARQSFGRVRAARRPAAAQAGAWHDGSAAADRADLGRGRLGPQRQLGP
jgi:Protein of unknown function (DUF2786)